jgi:[amino group carrier protein]-L-2-aminoadipate 6-kinase
LGKNNTIVIKLGGTEGVDFGAICQNVSSYIQDGQKVIIVHGGSEQANLLGEQLNYPPRFVTSPSGFSSRYTDRRTLEIFSMAVNGFNNTMLVEELRKLNVNALGLSGLDGGVLVAKRKSSVRIVANGKQKILRDDFTGKINHVNTELLNSLLESGYVPVVAPMASSEVGEALNVDADRAAAEIAGAINAETLILLTAVPGLMKDFPDESTLISDIKYSEIEQALDYSKGRMKKKILGAKEAILKGVKRVIISDGRVENPIDIALDGKGTTIYNY